VEGIGVLHQELAGSHDAESGPNLVAEFELDLIEIDRQLLVAAQFPPRDVGDHFLVRGAVGEVARMPVLEAQ